MAPTWGHSSKSGVIEMAAKKKPGRKAPAKKVAAVHRLREGMAKKKAEPAHVFEDVKPQAEFDFAALGEAKIKAANPVPEPGPVYCGPEPGIDKPYQPRYEGRDNTIPSDIEINLGQCHIWLRFR